jgi:multiple sugar transport system ATP-binding protein
MAEVVLERLYKNYGAVEAVRDVNLTIADGEFVVLVGPSGCGKSTTLRMVAGLEELNGGNIKFGGRIVNDLTPKQRNIAMVFQSYALYPHMTVFKNMAFGLKLKGFAKGEIKQRVAEAAALLDISELLERKPRELSGGQRQRVAMGRAIVRQPLVFLFDEPLSNLDAALRGQMRVEIKKLHKALATTIIYVTHDQIEAMTLADRIVVMNAGRVVQVGDPMTVYNRPIDKFVASFIGMPKMNFLPARLEAAGGGGLALHLEGGGTLAVPGSRTRAYEPYLNKAVELGIRPDHLSVGDAGSSAHADLEATIDVVEVTGAGALAFFSFAGVDATAQCLPHDTTRTGQRVRIMADMEHMHLIETDSGRVVPVDAASVDQGDPERVSAMTS